MKRTITAAIFLALSVGYLLGATTGRHSVAAQSANPRADLVTALRQDSAAMYTTIQTFRGHRAEYVFKNVNFVSGDLTGSNVTGTFVADDVDQMVTDMKTICDAIENGGTIGVGVWGNVLKIK